MISWEWLNWPIVLGVLGTVGAGIWALINRLGSEKFRQRALPPPTWPDMWKRMEEQRVRMDEQTDRIKALEDEREERAVRDRAITNILMSIARQWPPEHPPPVLDSDDLDILGEDTVPAQWFRFRPPDNLRRRPRPRET